MIKMIKERLKPLSVREKLLVGLASLAILLYLINLGVIAPLYKSYAARRGSLATLKQRKLELASMKQMVKENRPKIEALLAKKDLLKKRLAMAKNNITNSSRLNDILSLLSDPATGREITLIRLSIDSSPVTVSPGSPPKNALFNQRNNLETPLARNLLKYDRNEIKVSVKSGFRSLAYLFRNLSGSGLPLSISRFTIVRDISPSAPGLIANIDLLVYTHQND